eukprot:scaffold5236_cov20-Tisochrysis_lutea.AAC.1
MPEELSLALQVSQCSPSGCCFIRASFFPVYMPTPSGCCNMCTSFTTSLCCDIYASFIPVFVPTPSSCCNNCVSDSERVLAWPF